MKRNYDVLHYNILFCNVYVFNYARIHHKIRAWQPVKPLINIYEKV